MELKDLNKNNLLKGIEVYKLQREWKNIPDAWKMKTDEANSVDLSSLLEKVLKWDFDDEDNLGYKTCIDHPSLRVRGNRYVWFSKGDVNSKYKKQSSTIDFVRKYFGMNFMEAVVWLCEADFEKIDVGVSKVNEKFEEWEEYKTPDGFIKRRLKKKVEKPAVKKPEVIDWDKKIASYPKASNLKQTYGYLMGYRKLSKRIVDYLVKNNYILSKQEGRNATSTVYLFKDMEGKTVGYQKVNNMAKDGKRDPRIFGDNNVAFNLKFGEVKEVYFFEAVEDMLSWMVLFPKKCNNAHLIAMMGLKDATIEHYQNIYGIKVHYNLMTDNDEAGRKFELKILEENKYQVRMGEGYKNMLKSAEVKDWNDYLKKETN